MHSSMSRAQFPPSAAATAMDSKRQQCVACGNTAVSRCPFCTIRFYCSRDCQILDWKQNSHNTKCTRNDTESAAPQPPPPSKPAPPAASSKIHAPLQSSAAARPEQPGPPAVYPRPGAPYAPQHGMPRIQHPIQARPPYYGVPMWGAPPPNMTWPPLPGQPPDRRQSATPPNILPAPHNGNSKDQARRHSLASQTSSGPPTSRPGSAGASAPGFGRQVSHPHVNGPSLAQPGSRPAAGSGMASAGQFSAAPVMESLLVLSDSSSSSDDSGDEGPPGRVAHAAAAAATDPPRPPAELKTAGMFCVAGNVMSMEHSQYSGLQTD